jgi:hypothetical protein
MASITIQKARLRLKSPNRFKLQKDIFETFVLFQPKEWLTYAASEDLLLSSLREKWAVVVVSKNNEKRNTFARKYTSQAISIILHHSKTGKVKDFIINASDLRPELKEQLTARNIGGTPKQYYKIVDEIISNAVTRLFEDLDIVYYHKNLADKLRVRLEA